MPDHTTDHIHALTGQLAYVPIGGIPFVGVVPDDYLGPPTDRGIVAAELLAGAINTRSELSVAITSLLLTEAAELFPIYVSSATAGDVLEIVVPSTLGGTTQVTQNSSDLGFLLSRVSVFTRNNAAAQTLDRVIVRTIKIGVADTYVLVPGNIILRRGKNPGAPETEAITLRSVNDQRTVRILAGWRALDKRSL